MSPSKENMFKPFTLLLTLAATCSVASVFAGSRSSASYSVAAESSGAGGRRTSSASYANDSSIGEIVGVGTVAAPAVIARHGHVGQLYEVARLVLSANPTNVNEGATRQLAARAILDDATTLNLTGPAVAWSSVSGPILSISAGGLATAANVYESTPATVQGAWLGKVATLGLRVLNVGNDDFGTYASDGIDDAWQVQYFGQPPNANAGPLVDFDRDGQTNFFEYTAGLVPTDAASRFSITIAPVPGQPTRKNIIFTPLVLTGGRSYAVKFRTDLATGSWAPLTGTTQSDAGSVRTVTDTTATGAKKFYRVDITKP